MTDEKALATALLFGGLLGVLYMILALFIKLPCWWIGLVVAGTCTITAIIKKPKLID